MHPHIAPPPNRLHTLPIRVNVSTSVSLLSKTASFSVEAMVRGYHIYKDIWAAVVGKEFPCKREILYVKIFVR